MSGSQIAALIFGKILLIPGGCFLAFGIVDVGKDPTLLVPGVGILVVAALLFWMAFRNRDRPAPSSRRSS